MHYSLTSHTKHAPSDSSPAAIGTFSRRNCVVTEAALCCRARKAPEPPGDGWEIVSKAPLMVDVPRFSEKNQKGFSRFYTVDGDK